MIFQALDVGIKEGVGTALVDRTRLGGVALGDVEQHETSCKGLGIARCKGRILLLDLLRTYFKINYGARFHARFALFQRVRDVGKAILKSVLFSR